MAVIAVETFTGMRPAVAAHLLEASEAQSAFNVDTSTGELQPVFLARQETQYDSLFGCPLAPITRFFAIFTKYD